MFETLKPANDREENYYSALNILAEKTGTNRLLGYFSPVDFRLGHDGLRKLIQIKKVVLQGGRRLLLDRLKPGEFVVFVNREHTGVKLFGTGNIVAYQKLPKGVKLHPRAIALLPKYFNGKSLNLEGAQLEAIKKDFEKYCEKRSLLN